MIKSVPSSHSEVRDGVVVGLEDLGVVENLISERVESIKGHSDVGGRDPVLQNTQRGRTVRHNQAAVRPVSQEAGDLFPTTTWQKG